MIEQNQHLETLQDIRKMMQRSSRFISLSGLSGIAAGFWALAGAYVAHDWIYNINGGHYEEVENNYSVSRIDMDQLWVKLVLLAATVLGLALLSALYFTWRRAGKSKLPLWDHTTRKLTINTLIPLVTGGVFILALLQRGEWALVAPACLVFYGLALVNGSKYTLSDIRYLGMMEIALGLLNTQFVGYGLYFWALGFGVLHIVYGFIMWWKYERLPAAEIN
ncbi:MAG TPA: hypothetical protein VFR58_13025 [Flavisolibacter sp.]|nr:hypothetical protein [Flavisolibacter sp.]